MKKSLIDLYEELDMNVNHIDVDALERLEQWLVENLSHDILSTEDDILSRFNQYDVVLKKYFDVQYNSLSLLEKAKFAVDFGLDVLLENSALSHLSDRDVNFLLELACRKGHVYTAEKIGQCPSFNPEPTNEILHLALRLPEVYSTQLKENKQEIVQLLASIHPILILSKTGENNNIIHTLAENNYAELMSYFLDMRPDLARASNNLGYYPIHSAVLSLSFESVEVLLKVNPGANALDHQNRTPLHHACRLENFDLVKLCLESDRSLINHQDINQNTALNYANQLENEDVVKLLIENGALAPEPKSLRAGC